MPDFDQRNQHVEKQYNAGQDINYEEHHHPLYVPPKPPAAQKVLPTVIGLVFFVLFAGIVAYIAYTALHGFSFLQSSTPNQALSNFCTDLNTGDLQGAYNAYSDGLKSRTSSADFSNMWATKHIATCIPSVLNSSDSQASGTITTTEFPTHATPSASGPPPYVTTTYNVVLIKDDNGGWKIDSIR